MHKQRPTVGILLFDDVEVHDWIGRQDQRIQLTTSVCTGAFLLAEPDLLNQRQATMRWGSIDWMRSTNYEPARCLSCGRAGSGALDRPPHEVRLASD